LRWANRPKREAHRLLQTSQVHIIVPLAATRSFLAFRLATRAAVHLSSKADMAFEPHCLQTLLSRGAVRNTHTHTHTHTRLTALCLGIMSPAVLRMHDPCKPDDYEISLTLFVAMFHSRPPNLAKTEVYFASVSLLFYGCIAECSFTLSLHHCSYWRVRRPRLCHFRKVPLY